MNSIDTNTGHLYPADYRCSVTSLNTIATDQVCFTRVVERFPPSGGAISTVECIDTSQKSTQTSAYGLASKVATEKKVPAR